MNNDDKLRDLLDGLLEDFVNRKPDWVDAATERLRAFEKEGMTEAAEIADAEKCYPDCHSDYCIGRHDARLRIEAARDAKTK